MNINIEEVANKISKDDLYAYYKEHTKESTAQYFNIRQCVLNKLLVYYSISKSKEDTLRTREVTCLERFGAKNVFQSLEKQQKIKETNLRLYGAENPFASDIIKNRIKNTNIERYGFEYATQNKDVQVKTRNTLIQKYGYVKYFDNDKGKQTKLEKYGNPTYNNRVKAKDTYIKNYGVDNPFKSDSIKDKIKQTNIAKYGVPYSFQAEDVKYKSEQTMLQRYGKPHYTQTEEYKQKVALSYANKIEDLGFVHPSQSNYPDTFKQMLYDREKSICFLTSKHYSISSLCREFNCSETAVVKWLARLNLREYIYNSGGSIYEDELYDYLKGFGFKKHQRILDGKEIDLYNDSLKIGIEFNGDYWHSNLMKYKRYHEDKSKAAEQQGIRLIHIYEHEWNNERIKPILLSTINIAIGNIKSKIYARNCIVKTITNKEAKNFNNNNHLQGHRNAQVTYGLFYKDKLVQLMSFSMNKRYGWEIIRGCPGSNNIVVGGVSKLFKHFIKEYNPDTVFSYCDFNKFNGVGYEKLGMKFIGYTGPDKRYIINGKVYNRQPKRYKEFKENAEAVIWGAGSKKYLWTKE